jgi:DNA polymerase III epsilon subunit-like protein
MKNKIKPYSDNIIFFDTEFSSLNPYKGEILSMGFIKLNGEELYLEVEYDGEIDKWPTDNVLPLLIGKKVKREDTLDIIENFAGNQRPFLVSYINQFDIIYLYKLLGIDNHPFYWVPVDFSSILFGLGIDPEIIAKDENAFFEECDIDIKKYKRHHALDDAKLLRDIYLKITS